MKKCLLLIAVLISMSVSSQERKLRKSSLLESIHLEENSESQSITPIDENMRNWYEPQHLDSIIYRDSSGELAKKFVYDFSKGYKSNQESYLWDKDLSEWSKYHKREYVCDDAGREISTALYEGDPDGNWRCTFKYEVDFDDEGREIQITKYRNRNGIIKTIDQYDEYGNNVLHSILNWSSSANDWVESYREQHFYDGERLLKTDYRRWDITTHEMVEGKIDDYTYNESQKDFSIHQIWDTTNKNWIEHQKTDYIYNGGNVSEEVTSTWDAGNAIWTKTERNTYSYYDNGKIKTKHSYSINESDLIGALYFWAEYEYDSEGRIIVDGEYYENNDDPQKKSRRYEYAYDEAGRTILYIHYIYSFGSLSSTSTKTESQYNDKGDRISHYEWIWSSELGEWVGKNRFELILDYRIGKSAASISYSWDRVNKQWVFYSKIVDSYDDKWNDVLHERYSWSRTENDWIVSNRNKTDYVYNEFENPDTGIEYIWKNTDFAINYTIKYYYKSREDATGVDNTQNKPIHIHPNPATDYITIDHLTDTNKPAVVIIYDMTGRVCVESRVIPTQPLSVAHLKEGIYLYQVITEHKNHTGKLVIKQ